MIKVKAPKSFIDAYKKSEKARLEVPKFLSDITKYNEEWCDKNRDKAYDLLTEEQRKEVGELALWAQFSKNKMWSDYYCANFETVKDYVIPPASINYNPKTKMMEMRDGKEISSKVKDLISDFKNKIDKLTK